VVNRPDHGWFWFIPISGSVVSVGVVVPRSAYAEVGATKPTPEEALAHFVAETPGAAHLLAEARAVGPARLDADYSYLHSRHAGDRFVLVGDAGAFLDPIFSTGVLLAMQSGIEAAEVMSEGLRRGDLGARRFARYERRLVRRYRHFRRFVVGFYDAPFRDVFFNRKPYFGIYAAVLSVLSGNWRPSLKTRAALRLFFALVALQRLVLVVSRRSPVEAPVGRP
jgi:flavin-dependent dehydrogenase